MARYFRIVPVFHHIRWRLIKNQTSKRGSYGSVALLARRDHLNFASVIDEEMWKIGNTMSEVWERSGVGINLDAYE